MEGLHFSFLRVCYIPCGVAHKRRIWVYKKKIGLKFCTTAEVQYICSPEHESDYKLTKKIEL